MGAKKIIIIGAGIGGTALAARLVKQGQGHDVTVYEKNSFHGGRCSLIHHDGHRFDQGPSLLLMREIFEETFLDLGTTLDEHLTLLKCSPNYKVHFNDGQSIELTSDLTTLLREITRFEGNSEKVTSRVLKFLTETQVHYSKSVTHALKTNYETIWNLFQLKAIPLIWKLHIWDTVYGRVCKYFKTDHMRRAFTFQTMYLGMSPYDAPAPYNLLQYTEIAGGIWYPKGGFTTVVQSLETIAKSHGATFIYNSEVTEVKVNEKKNVTGIIVNGEYMEADIVVCNADLVYAYNNLLPKTKYGKVLGEKGQLTSSSISFYWSLSTEVKGLLTHNIFLTQEYKSSFDQIFKEHTLPSEPSFYINVPSRIDPTAAPPGKDSVAVLVPVGHLTGVNEQQQHIHQLVTLARNHVIMKLEKHLKITNFSTLIEHEVVNDPIIWEEKFNLWKGSILGLSHNYSQVLSFRPKTRSKEFKNLYFVGASTQPGTGVPVVLCGAKLVAKQICADLLKADSKDLCGLRVIMLILFIIIILILLIFLLYTY